MNFLKDENIFDSLKSCLVFAAAVGAEQGIRCEFTESAEKIPLRIFNESQDLPFMLALALSITGDISYFRADKMDEVILIFEETAAAGLDYLEGSVDQSNPKESIERLVIGNNSGSMIDDLAKIW
ncbi:hypothetical protein DWB85_18585 [Seongchinamella sediminis]|uniref:Uncharacterized protein n=2 Tax=Seongchinamella sediminis TaxID=2283635 RepID=A0A3L7DUH0_9GAMM|nr:hypothetical protein DWB85_18585 [Seongchinamella sediminis]